ncbi:MAG: hypothetical protein IJE99_02030 [Alistipes sp.]|nr:hypothetical protein [Alistipes sp.]
MLRHKVLVIIGVTLLLVGCNREVDEPTPNSVFPTATLSIKELHDYASPTEVSHIAEDLIIVGRVTSSDSASNFYRSMVVEDDSGAVEVMVGGYNLHTHFPEGLKVALRLSGCAISYKYGVLQVGKQAAAHDPYDIEYLATKQLVDRVIVRSTDVRPRRAQHLRIKELDGARCGRLVCIDSLSLVGSTSIDTLAGQTLKDAKWRGYATFVDPDNDTLVIYTREYASYATRNIPNTTLSLQGIVQYAKYPDTYHYQLKMRDERDCSPY